MGFWLERGVLGFAFAAGWWEGWMWWPRCWLLGLGCIASGEGDVSPHNHGELPSTLTSCTIVGSRADLQNMCWFASEEDLRSWDFARVFPGLAFLRGDAGTNL